MGLWLCCQTFLDFKIESSKIELRCMKMGRGDADRGYNES